MYRQNKQFMKDPATAPARIYIGGLQNTVLYDDLDMKFREYGKILGLSLQKGFAFIQYESPENAKRAITGAQGSILHGRKITVKPANAPKGKIQNQGQLNSSMPNPPENPPPPLIPREPDIVPKEPSPPKMQTPEPPKNNWDEIREDSPEHFDEEQQNKSFEGEDQRNRNESGNAKNTSRTDENQYFEESPPKIMRKNDNFDDKRNNKNDNSNEYTPWTKNKKGNLNKNQNRERNDNGKWNEGYDNRNDRKPKFGRNQNDRFNPPIMQEKEMFSGNQPFYNPRFSNFQEFPPAPVPDTPDRNDCEIIVVVKQLTEYAEYIEQRLKAVGLIVDLLFPNEDVPIGKVLANISSRGCLYAILVMPINKENKSLTLNILHGIPQEHRNIPLDDAILLITRNFDAYMRGDKSCPDSVEKLSVHDKHPQNMQVLINMVAENRAITSVQYNELIKYLEERRDLQLEYEEREGIDVNVNKTGTKEAELQNRILSILNNKNKSSADSPSNFDSDSKLDLENSTPEPTPLLKDPTVQRALESLNLGDIFKNIASD